LIAYLKRVGTDLFKPETPTDQTTPSAPNAGAQ
jgi:hypothetical protein